MRNKTNKAREVSYSQPWERNNKQNLLSSSKSNVTINFSDIMNERLTITKWKTQIKV